MLIWATWGYLRWGPQEKRCFVARDQLPSRNRFLFIPTHDTNPQLRRRLPGTSATVISSPRRCLSSMAGDGFDMWGSQLSLSGPGLVDLNLNSQAPTVEGFPGLGLLRSHPLGRWR